jgi:hypothetical protein
MQGVKRSREVESEIESVARDLATFIAVDEVEAIEEVGDEEAAQYIMALGAPAPKRRRNALLERLQAAVVARSVARTWREACGEWRLARVRVARACDGVCACSKRGLRYMCVLRNAVNGALVVVGSDCVARFHETAADLKATVDSAFRCLKRVEENPWHAALNRSLGALALDCGFVSEEDAALARANELKACELRRIGVPPSWARAVRDDDAWTLMFANLDVLNAFCEQPACACGAPSELRARKRDGAIFHGCSTYPACQLCSDDALARGCSVVQRGVALRVAPRASPAWVARREARAAIVARAARHRAARAAAAADWKAADAARVEV